MSEQDNVKVVRAFWDALNAHDLDKLEQFYGPNFRADDPGAPGMTKEQHRAFLQGMFTAFPDLKFTIEQTIASGDTVVTNWTAAGTHTGPMLTPSGQTIPPTGKKGIVPGSDTMEVKGGKVTRVWAFWDRATLLGQLGLLPPM